MQPLVSVIIPTCNGERHIRETLESVFLQTYSSLEVIVVDDGSVDATVEIVAACAPQARIISQTNAGHPSARNTGIRAATGEFLSFLDHDDLWLPSKIEQQVRCLVADPALDLVFGHIQNFLSPELPEEDRTRILARMDPLPGLLQGAMLARRSSFDRVGFFSEEWVMGDFLDWYGRAQLLNLKMLVQSETVLMRRIHSSNTQRTQKHMRRQSLVVLKQLLDKRRLAVVGDK